MDAGTRLTRDQLGALAPGDAVTIESGAEFGRIRHETGTVARVTAVSVFVRVDSARGVPYVQEYRVRDGWRAGRGSYDALVQAPRDGTEELPQRRSVDALWRTWSRNRGDVKALRELHAAIEQQLAELQPTA